MNRLILLLCLLPAAAWADFGQEPVAADVNRLEWEGPDDNGIYRLIDRDAAPGPGLMIGAYYSRPYRGKCATYRGYHGWRVEFEPQESTPPIPPPTIREGDKL